MSSGLEAAFGAYARRVESRLRPLPKKSRGNVSVIASPVARIREVVEQLEGEAAFDNLVVATREAFSARDSDLTGRSIWQHAVRNFFRRSSLYLTASSRAGRLNSPRWLTKYETAFNRPEYEITYLAPMELVRFTRPSFRFDGFGVRRFSRVELSRRLEVEVNRVFYPWAAIDADLLAPYWFICRTITRARPERLGDFGINLADLEKVEPYRSPFRSLDPALRPLVLYGWQWDLWRDEPVEAQEAWMAFRLPFVLAHSDDLLASPQHAPDLRDLQTTPQFDAATGEELGDAPDIAISLNPDETANFDRLVRQFAKLLSTLNLDEHGWQFVSVAAGYLVKAFFAEGMEQLLWHITTLESLLGEKAEGVVQQVANRLAAILGRTENERKALRRQYRHLYGFRSVLVHGGPFEEQVLTRHLREARDLARAVLVWVLAFLAHFQGRSARGGSKLPTRKDLLRLLDMDETTRARMSKALANLPADFPKVKGW